jgi:hypothetical protein
MSKIILRVLSPSFFPIFVVLFILDLDNDEDFQDQIILGLGVSYSRRDSLGGRRRDGRKEELLQRTMEKMEGEVVSDEFPEEKETQGRYNTTCRKKSRAHTRASRKETAEEMENGFGESISLFCDRIHFAAKGK